MTADKSSRMPEPAFAYLSKRKLHVRRNGAIEEIDSEFAHTVRERAASIERRHAWKTQGRGAMFMGGLWAASPDIRSAPRVMLTGLSAVPDGGLLYSMETDAVSGLFVREWSGVETRLFHTADLRLRHAALHPDGALVAATSFHPADMRSNIAVLPLHGTDFSEVTEGDSFDQVPQWVPGAKRRIMFQSAGVGRDGAGHFVGFGPSTIQQLDLDSQDLDEVASEQGYDLLQPRPAPGGGLYYVRKPYESNAPDASVLGSIKDAVLFPLRMACAVLQYFNVFSMMYTGKPLVSSKGAAQRRMDPRQMFIQSNLGAAAQAGQSDEDGRPLVPASWELIRRAPNGGTNVIANRVLAFDIAGDGSLLHTDGGSITRLGPDGSSDRLVDAEFIERVLAL